MIRLFRIAWPLWLWSTLAWSGTLGRKPYLQDVHSDRAVIAWTTVDAAGDGEVRFSADGARWTRVASTSTLMTPDQTGLSAPFYQHRANLTGLAAGTSYFYRVFLDGQDALPSVPQTDMTLRTPTAAESFRFLVVGDSGDGAAEQNDVAYRMFQDPGALLLHVGDLAYDSGTFLELESYYFSTDWPLMRHIPFFPAPGNHDYYFRYGAAYRSSHVVPIQGVPRDGQGRYYSFDWSNVHFVSLDTNEPFQQALEGKGAMLEWLDADLAATRQPWRIVYFHHIPFPTSAHRDDATCAQVLQYLTPILERHQVHIVFGGHEHVYQRTKPRRNGQFLDVPVPATPPNGTIYITTGGGGSRAYPAGNDSFITASAGVSHYLRVVVEGVVLTVTAFDRSGIVLDRFQMSVAPVIDSGAITDSASGGRSLAPGGLITVYGANLAPGDATAAALPWPSTLGGVSATASGQPVPLLFVSRGQINAQLPFDVSPTATLEVSTPSGKGAEPMRVADAAPAIFRVPTQQGLAPAIVHLDGTLVTSSAPAAAGEWVSVYLTGLGAVAPPITAGRAAPALPLARATAAVRVTVGGAAAEVSFSGLTPGLSGLYQINLKVPAALPAGPQPLQITAAGLTDTVRLELP
ncbi:MAG: metallophosphoesterase [Bryobacterales bacterium]|nr:metallophosphoesterase [Bryobacterales bacterium]